MTTKRNAASDVQAACAKSLVGNNSQQVLSNDAIAASSSIKRAGEFCTPDMVRIGSGSAWCAASKRKPWIEFDFGKPMKINEIKTQGRADRLRLMQWVEKYKVMYTATGECWKEHPTIFTANNDSNTIRNNPVEPAIVAQWIRIMPLEWHRHPSMRVDIVGCKATGSAEDECPPEPYAPEYINQEAYDEVEARTFLGYGRASYCSKPAIDAWSCGEMCSKQTIVPGSAHYMENQEFKLAGYVAQLPTVVGVDGKRCVAAFRGLTSMANWKTNLKFPRASWPPNGEGGREDATEEWCKNCFTHKGFAKSWEAMREQFMAAVDAAGCESVSFTGHGLGGVMAVFASFETRVLLQLPVPVVYTYGLPRIGNKAFVRAYIDAASKQGLGAPIWRIVRYHDPVPRLPPIFLGFSQMPQEVYYKKKMFEDKYRICNSTRKVLEDETCSWKKSAATCINDQHTKYFEQSLKLSKFPAECEAKKEGRLEVDDDVESLLQAGDEGKDMWPDFGPQAPTDDD